MSRRARIVGRYDLHAILPDGSEVRAIAHNTPTNEGMQYLLDVLCNNTSNSDEHPNRTVRFGFVDTAGWTAGYSAADTLASHAGWDEITLLGGRYIAGGTQAAQDAPGTTATKLIWKRWSYTNTAFTCRGVFLCDTNSGAGHLFSTADWAEGVQDLPIGTDLTINYSLTISSA